MQSASPARLPQVALKAVRIKSDFSNAQPIIKVRCATACIHDPFLTAVHGSERCPALQIDVTHPDTHTCC